MTGTSEPTLTDKLRRIRQLLLSKPLSEHDPAVLAYCLSIIQAYPIEWAEVTASDKQIAFQRKFLDRRDTAGRRLRVLAALGANRSGKSYVAGRLCFSKYIRDHAKAGDVFWCIAATLGRSVGGQQLELRDALPKWKLGDQTWSEKIGFGGHRSIVVATNDGGRCLIEFRSADQAATTFEQAKLRGIWCDEAMPEEIYNRILARVIDLDGFILISDIPGSWWHHSRLINAPPEAGVYYQHMRMVDNAHNLPQGAIEQAAAGMTEDERRMRIDGEMVIMEGVVYRQFIDLPRDPFDPYKGGHLVKPFRIPDHWPKWRSIDYGASAPTACLWTAIGENEDIYCYREHYAKNLSVKINAEMILAASGDEEYVKTLMDPHAIDPPPVYYGAADTIAIQYKAAGIPSTGWPYMQGVEHAAVQRVKFKFETRKLWVFDNLINFRRELRSWKYLTDTEGRPKAVDKFEADNNHLLDTLKGFIFTGPCFTNEMIRVNPR